MSVEANRTRTFVLARFFLWSCRESNPLLYLGKCLLKCAFVTFRSNSFQLSTCRFPFGS